MKNPSWFYDENYLHGRMSKDDPDALRGEDNGIHYATAVMAAELAEPLGARTFVDVGCGRGFVVRHLRRMGLHADGMEYGQAARDGAVIDDILFCDLTATLPVEGLAYDFAVCVGVLSHIPERLVLHSLRELRRVTRVALLTNILTLWSHAQQHHKTFRCAGWWIPMFERAGWKNSGADLTRYGLNTQPEQFASLWVPADHEMKES